MRDALVAIGDQIADHIGSGGGLIDLNRGNAALDLGRTEGPHDGEPLPKFQTVADPARTIAGCQQDAVNATGKEFRRPVDPAVPGRSRCDRSSARSRVRKRPCRGSSTGRNSSGFARSGNEHQQDGASLQAQRARMPVDLVAGLSCCIFRPERGFSSLIGGRPASERLTVDAETPARRAISAIVGGRSREVSRTGAASFSGFLDMSPANPHSLLEA